MLEINLKYLLGLLCMSAMSLATAQESDSSRETNAGKREQVEKQDADIAKDQAESTDQNTDEQSKTTVDIFTPSESISEDYAVPFPTDI